MAKTVIKLCLKIAKGKSNMNLDLVLRDDERAIFKLRSLYGKYGYTQYKMSKFEEYDLYALNKEFLVSDNIITFTDTDGKLMALKPDVTLSIIKNGTDSKKGVQKVFYDENVYRVSKGTKSFKEIMQAGLECVGDVDDYAVLEVIMLAIKSLEIISSEYVLDLSSLDILNCIFDKANLSASARKQIIAYLSQKNVKGVEDVLSGEGVLESDKKLLKALVLTYGSPKKVQKVLSEFELNDSTKNAVDKLFDLVDDLDKLGLGDKINIDFSVVNDLNYYNGLVFKGFVSGFANSILSGGQYDKLMQKMNKKSRAIGFAVYLDELSKLKTVANEYDVDVAIEYGNADRKQVIELVDKLTKQGKSVLAEKQIAGGVRYREIIRL